MDFSSYFSLFFNFIFHRDVDAYICFISIRAEKRKFTESKFGRYAEQSNIVNIQWKWFAVNWIETAQKLGRKVASNRDQYICLFTTYCEFIMWVQVALKVTCIYIYMPLCTNWIAVNTSAWSRSIIFVWFCAKCDATTATKTFKYIFEIRMAISIVCSPLK